MKRAKTTTILLTAFTLLMSSCHRDGTMTFNFNATMEQPTGEDGGKVFLQNERFIFWEEGDNITIASDRGYWHAENAAENKYATATLTDIGNIGGEVYDDFHFFNGVFVTTLVEGSKYFLGAYPKFTIDDIPVPSGWCQPTQGSSDFGTVKLKVPTYQPVRTALTAGGTDISDYSFDKNIFPMIAWYGGAWSDSTTAFNLDFHSVGTIVRVQLYNYTANEFTLDSIVFTSKNTAKQLSGIFEVENYKTEDPNLKTTWTGGTSAAEKAKTDHIVVGKKGQSLGIPFVGSTLRSFYVVLPAYAGRHATTTYNLTMTIYATKGNEQGTFTKEFTANTRRNGITYMPAIAVTNWETHTTTATIPGYGTRERPFKIYTANDLIYLRYCYNTTHKINNQPIDDFTEGGPHIRIMRSDIVLGNNWTEDDGTGIRNFKGTMTYTTSGTNTVQAITNNSGKPLFVNIEEGGTVEGITVNCNASVTLASDSYTPFCNTNRGVIKNCRVISVNNGSNGVIYIQTPGGADLNVAGICLNNYGTITGCGCMARFNTPGRHVAGICHTNETGTIKECYVAAPMDVLSAATVGGICHNNGIDGTVKDCYFANVLNEKSFDCGGIVHTNSGMIEHCYMGETSSITTSGYVGGIVKNNQNHGTVNYCWAEGLIRGGSAGLIACDNYGNIVNSFCNNNYTFVTLSTTNNGLYAGGLVAYHYNGTIANSFIHYNRVQRINNIGNIGGLVGLVTGSTATIKNCYAFESHGTNAFYNTAAGTTASTFDNCYLVDGTQTDITEIIEATAAGITTYNTSATDTLRNLLNANLENGWYEWRYTSQSNRLPVLKAYVPGSGKRRR